MDFLGGAPNVTVAVTRKVRQRVNGRRPILNVTTSNKHCPDVSIYSQYQLSLNMIFGYYSNHSIFGVSCTRFAAFLLSNLGSVADAHGLTSLMLTR